MTRRDAIAAMLEAVKGAQAAAWAVAPPSWMPAMLLTPGEEIMLSELEKLDDRTETWTIEAGTIDAAPADLYDAWLRTGRGLAESYQVWAGSPADSFVDMAAATVKDAAQSAVDLAKETVAAARPTLRWGTVAIVAAAILALVWLVAPLRRALA